MLMIMDQGRADYILVLFRTPATLRGRGLRSPTAFPDLSSTTSIKGRADNATLATPA